MMNDELFIRNISEYAAGYLHGVLSREKRKVS
jgi:hypothetical protein